MTETPSSSEPVTHPVASTAAAPPTVVEREPRRSGRLTQVAALVAIVAGVVFIVAVIFFSGFMLGAHSGGHRGGGHDRGDGPVVIHRGGPPGMFPMGPGGGFERPGSPFGPGFQPPQGPGASGAPTTTAPARP